MATKTKIYTGSAAAASTQDTESFGAIDLTRPLESQRYLREVFEKLKFVK